MQDDTTIVLTGDVNLRLWRETLVEYYVLMDRADRLLKQGELERAESIRDQAGTLLRSFPMTPQCKSS